jgi:hypothetical protein
LVAVITDDFWAITWCRVGVVVRWSSAFAAVKGTTIVAQGFSARGIALIQDFFLGIQKFCIWESVQERAHSVLSHSLTLVSLGATFTNKTNFGCSAASFVF